MYKTTHTVQRKPSHRRTFVQGNAGVADASAARTSLS